jgi:hypothetical protein
MPGRSVILIRVDSCSFVADSVSASVFLQRRINLIGPGDDAAFQVADLSEA